MKALPLRLQVLALLCGDLILIARSFLVYFIVIVFRKMNFRPDLETQIFDLSECVFLGNDA